MDAWRTKSREVCERCDREMGDREDTAQFERDGSPDNWHPELCYGECDEPDWRELKEKFREQVALTEQYRQGYRDASGEVKAHESAIEQHLPEYELDDGSNREPSYRERVEHAGAEIARLREAYRVESIAAHDAQVQRDEWKRRYEESQSEYSKLEDEYFAMYAGRACPRCGNWVTMNMHGEPVDCAREEAVMRLVEMGADPGEIEWWLSWANRRNANVLERLVEALRSIASGAEWGDHARTLATDALRRAMIPESDSCLWTFDADTDSWDTACGNKHIFEVDGPFENLHRWCPYCGAHLKNVSED